MVGALQIPGFRVLRKEGGARNQKGNLFFVRLGAPCVKLDNVEKASRPIDQCFCILRPTKREDYQLRITDIYVLLFAQAEPEISEQISGLAFHTRGRNAGLVSQPIAGT